MELKRSESWDLGNFIFQCDFVGKKREGRQLITLGKAQQEPVDLLEKPCLWKKEDDKQKRKKTKHQLVRGGRKAGSQ